MGSWQNKFLSFKTITDYLALKPYQDNREFKIYDATEAKVQVCPSFSSLCQFV